MITALIPARGGSKRVHMKNIRSLGGRPLIDWTISCALNSARIQQSLVSTDDSDVVGNSTFLSMFRDEFNSAEIGKIIGICPGLFLHKRGMFTSNDQAKTISLVEEIDSDFVELSDEILLLQPTSPFRTISEIDSIVEVKLKSGSESVFSVARATSPHPYKTFRLNATGGVDEEDSIFETLSTPEQNLPVLYSPDGAYYLSDKNALLERKKFVTGNSTCFVRSGPNTMNIDTEEDLLYAQYLIDSKLVQF